MPIGSSRGRQPLQVTAGRATHLDGVIYGDVVEPSKPWPRPSLSDEAVLHAGDVRDDTVVDGFA